MPKLGIVITPSIGKMAKWNGTQNGDRHFKEKKLSWDMCWLYHIACTSSNIEPASISWASPPPSKHFSQRISTQNKVLENRFSKIMYRYSLQIANITSHYPIMVSQNFVGRIYKKLGNTNYTERTIPLRPLWETVIFHSPSRVFPMYSYDLVILLLRLFAF